MNLKRFARPAILLLVLAVLVVGLVACERPSSKGPTTVTTSGPTFPVPATEQTTGGLDTNAFSTATAAAAGGVQVATPAPTLPPAVTAAAPTSVSVPETAPTQAPAPTSAPASGPAPAEEVPDSYTLEPGEFPYCIARRFDINPVELLSYNGLNANSATSPGQTLKIPQNAGGFPGDRSLHDHPTNYTVRSGDTLYEIACYFGDVYPETIAHQNNLSAPYTLQSGQTLSIP